MRALFRPHVCDDSWTTKISLPSKSKIWLFKATHKLRKTLLTSAYPEYTPIKTFNLDKIQKKVTILKCVAKLISEKRNYFGKAASNLLIIRRKKKQ